MDKIRFLSPFIILISIVTLSSCAFINGLFDEYFEGKAFIEDGINITITSFDYYSYPGPSDHKSVKAYTYPQISWELQGVSGIAEYWIFVYSPLLYNEGLTASILPDVWVIEDISPTLSSNEFGNIPPGAYEWVDPVFQPLKYNGTYIFWVAACDEYNGWIGLGMAEVTVYEGIEPPTSPPQI